MNRYFYSIRKSMKRLYILIIAGIIFCLGISLQTSAQGDPSCDPLPGSPESCPIDGGLSLLIAAGIGIGAKKAYDKRKKDSRPHVDM